MYYVTGRLGLLLALPPGYASLVWPPLGLSIAALLLWGTNRWPGVLLGSLLINIYILEVPSETIIGYLMASGNTVGVVVGTTLVRRFLHFPKKFYLEKEILIFLLFAGPVSALFSATIGISVLGMSGLISPENTFSNWLHWFVGDSTGGIIFAPLALMFSTQSRKYWLKSVTKVLLPVSTSFALILIGSHYLNTAELDKMDAEFTNKAQFTYNALSKNLSTNLDMMASLQSFFNSSADVTEQEFKDFVAPLLSRHPEIQALTWIATRVPESFTVQYVEPDRSNSQFKNIDLAKDPRYSEMVQKTLDKRRVVTSARTDFAPYWPGEGLVLMLSTPRHSGVLAQFVRLDEILKDVSSIIDDPGFRIQINDVTDGLPVTMVDSWKLDGLSKEASKIQFHSPMRWASHFEIGDRIWEVQIFQDPQQNSLRAASSSLFLLASLSFVFLICALLLTIANRIITIEEIVDEKTQHLLDLNMQLKKASETKSEFLANMSHEIRTPLNVIIGMADLIDESPLNDEQRHYLEVSRKAGQNLLTIINDILDISKIESGLVSLENTEVDLHELVRETCDMFQIKAREKGLLLSLHLSPATHNIYAGDPLRIRQILSNLISNALKFTSQGSVRVELFSGAPEDMSGNIHFNVVDTGIGIPSDKIPSLFQPFTQADSTITRKFGGTGLGLSICKRLVSMMGGQITLQSTPGIGSRFTFSLDLPLIRACETKTPTPVVPFVEPEIASTSKEEEGLAILIVDDTEDNRMLIRAYLKNTAHIISEAANGLEALNAVKQQNFDLILMDMQMPVMDGFTATAHIRQWESDNNRPVMAIWALTAYALQNEIERSLQVGCNFHLVKPLRKAELLNHIQRLMMERRRS